MSEPDPALHRRQMLAFRIVLLLVYIVAPMFVMSLGARGLVSGAGPKAFLLILLLPAWGMLAVFWVPLAFVFALWSAELCRCRQMSFWNAAAVGTVLGAVAASATMKVVVNLILVWSR